MVVRSVVRRSRLGELGVSRARFGAAGVPVPVGATVEIPIDKKIKASVTIENTGSRSLTRDFTVFICYADTLSDSSGDPETDFTTWYSEADETDVKTETGKTLNPGDTLTIETSGIAASHWNEGDIIDAGVIVYASVGGTYEYYDSLKITDAVKIIAPTLRVEITDVTFSEYQPRKFELTLVKGPNYVSIPLLTPMRASDLVEAISDAGGEVTVIRKIDAETQSFVEYKPEEPTINNFRILPYEGYMIGCNKGCELEIEGEGVTEHTYVLPAAGGWGGDPANSNIIFIGVPFITDLKASDIYNMLENPDYVCKFEAGTGVSTCYPLEEDFPLRCGEGYYVAAYNTRDISFTLSGEPCGELV